MHNSQPLSMAPSGTKLHDWISMPAMERTRQMAIPHERKAFGLKPHEPPDFKDASSLAPPSHTSLDFPKGRTVTAMVDAKSTDTSQVTLGTAPTLKAYNTKDGAGNIAESSSVLGPVYQSQVSGGVTVPSTGISDDSHNSQRSGQPTTSSSGSEGSRSTLQFGEPSAHLANPAKRKLDGGEELASSRGQKKQLQRWWRTFIAPATRLSARIRRLKQDERLCHSTLR